MWFLNSSHTNQPAQSQKQARNWKFTIKKVEELCYPCSKNKGADQRTTKLICIFFAYADCRFFHEAAHILNTLNCSIEACI